MAVQRGELLQFLDETYERQTDWQHNGLQVEGKDEIKTLVTGVSLCCDLIEEAIKLNADAILVHHGFFGKSFLCVTGAMKKRLALLLKHNISLFAYHLPMDAHPTLGHNAQLSASANLLIDKFHSCGCYCTNPKGLTGHEIIKQLSEFCDRTSFSTLTSIPKVEALCSTFIYGSKVWDFNSVLTHNKQIKRVFVCSGGSSSMIDEIEDVDLFIFGEPKESSISTARDRSITLVALGHWRSEQGGLWAVGDIIAKRYGIATKYVPIVNDV